MLIVGATLMLLSAVGGAQSAPSPERQLFDAANRERRAQGVPALQWDESLATAARKHALEMAKRGAVSHQFPGEANLPTRARQAGVRYRSLAENVDQGPSAEAIQQALMMSPLHRANILDSGMDSAGIGAAKRGSQWFVVEDFSKAR